MAIIQNSMVNNFLSSVTGNTNKAYILLRKNYQASPGSSLGMDSLDVPGLGSGLDALAGTLQSTVESVASGSKNALAFTSLKDIKNAVSGDFLPVQVQYNPASLSFTGTQGSVRRSGVDGQNQFAQMDVPVETVMQIALTFDDTNIKDAFLFERLNLTTVGGVLQSVEQIGAAVKGGYGVQDISEVFVGAMVRPMTRWMAFVWNKMIFWGELVGVNVRYTMFNPSGSPIRSNVTLRIRQDSPPGETRYQTEKSWEKAFEKMFKTKYRTNGAGVTNKVSNLLNF